MQKVPCYPDFIPLDINLKEVLHPRLSLTSDGVSEFTFAGLYLFRNQYNYRISRDVSLNSALESAHNNTSGSVQSSLESGGFIISGIQPSGENRGKTFFMTPCAAPGEETLKHLLKTHDYWKNISESVLAPLKDNFQENNQSSELSFIWPEYNLVIREDRNNFDYLYYRSDLAELSGKKYHKKKNHVNNFLGSYPDHEQRPMSTALIPAAIEILDRWRYDTQLKNEGKDGDFKSAREALELFDTLALKGSVFFINGKPTAYCLGESIARGKMFAIHFEKAIDEYRGIYQFINQAFAASLPRFFTLINREQDLGNEGLRQAKMTYRPCNFVKKYIANI